MVKGVSRQVIVVRQPDTKLFEQAIFLLREDALGKDGLSDREILKEACTVADHFVKSKGGRRPRRHLSGLFCMLIGAAATGLIWLLTSLL